MVAQEKTSFAKNFVVAQQIKKTAVAVFLVRKPVSRVLSWVTICLERRLPGISCNLPKEDAGYIVLFLLGLAPGGVYLAG